MDTTLLETSDLIPTMWEAVGGNSTDLPEVTLSGEGSFRSKFAITDLAASAYAVCGAAISELVGQVTGERAAVHVDRTLASASFELPPRTFHVPGNLGGHGAHPWFRHYRSSDDRYLWVQAIFPTPRKRVVEAMGVSEDPDALAAEFLKHTGEEIEARVVEGRGVIGMSRTAAEWQSHPQGRAVASEQLVARETTAETLSDWQPTPGRPLAGVRVLDLTRVVAGPTGTRFLAAAGAEVLRIDAPGSDETETMSGAFLDHNAGKRRAYLNLKTDEGRTKFLELLADCDVLVHSYRPGGIDALVDPELRTKVRPGLIEVTLTAFGWTGPWRNRRGFDTIVQYSTGIADETTAWALDNPEQRVPLDSVGGKAPADRPRHLPVEALDLVTGYLLAATVIRGLTERLGGGCGSLSRLSLARTAALLRSTRADEDAPPLSPPVAIEYESQILTTGRGPGRRMPFPVNIADNPLFWERPVELPGSSSPKWSTPRRH